MIKVSKIKKNCILLCYKVFAEVFPLFIFFFDQLLENIFSKPKDFKSVINKAKTNLTSNFNKIS